MKKVYFAQINNQIADAIFLPLSVAYIWEYCRSLPEISAEWELGKIFFERESVEDILNNIVDPDVFGISCYVWNWEISLTLSKEIKKKYPNCKIVLGGPQPPYSQTWLDKTSYVDYIVAYAGESAFSDILLGKKNIPGVYSKEFSYTESPPVKYLNDIPSPYLSGLMNSIMKSDVKYSAIIETNRGCPYRCTFCDQESEYYTKVYKFDYNRVMDEIDWVSANKIEFVSIADSNLGIFDRDLDFMRRFAHNRRTTGYPRQIDYSTAKQQPKQILEIGKIINQEAGIKRGVTIALQSMNPKTLSAIKRINVANSKLEQIIQNYNDNGIDNYCELILGLPEESFDTWVAGLSKILEIGSEHALTMHPLSILPNTPFGTKQYKDKYGLEYVKTKSPAGSNFYEDKVYEEYDYICCASNTMTRDEWVECYFLTKGIIIPHHYHGVSQVAAEYLNRVHNIPLIDYYLKVYEYSKNSTGVLNNEYQEHTKSVRGSLENTKYWGRKINESKFYFQDNAATSACLYKDIDIVHKEITDLVLDQYRVDISEVLRYNRLILNTYNKSINNDMFNKNYNSWFRNKQDLIDIKTKVTVDIKKYNDVEEHTKDLFWFGRKSKRCYLDSKEMM